MFGSESKYYLYRLEVIEDRVSRKRISSDDTGTSFMFISEEGRHPDWVAILDKIDEVYYTGNTGMTLYSLGHPELIDKYQYSFYEKEYTLFRVGRGVVIRGCGRGLLKHRNKRRRVE